MVRVYEDRTVDFPAFHVGAKTTPKSLRRRFVAEHVLDWVTFQRSRGVRGCVYADIDDTLIDGNERVTNGFEHMLHMLQRASMLCPVYICTARPDDDKENVMKLLHARGVYVTPDRLYMLPAHLYDRSSRHVEEFKAKTYDELVRKEGAVLARCGDKLWDVAHLDSLDTYLKHVDDKDCYVFFDPRLGGCLSAKLPGA